MQPSGAALFESNVSGMELIHRGKVRDLYAIDDNHMLIVATDRLSAFDVILPDPMPTKGIALTRISNFWFKKTQHIVSNHLTTIPLEEVVSKPDELKTLTGRAVVVRRLQTLPIEAVVRGYLIGSGWKDYQDHGAVCGLQLPGGLKMAQQLKTPLYTPATKAAVGDHDENIDFQTTVSLLGEKMANQVRQTALALYEFAYQYAYKRGIIIADTKFEFGVDSSGKLTLIDEALTPDSSRFWDLDTYRVGESPPSFDKQIVRDYLETLDWNKQSPGPKLPQEVLDKTRAKYEEALSLLIE